MRSCSCGNLCAAFGGTAEFEKNLVERHGVGLEYCCAIASEFMGKRFRVTLDDVPRSVGIGRGAKNGRAAGGQCRASDREAVKVGSDVVEWTLEEDSAAVHDTDVIGYLFDLRELMAGEKYGAAFGSTAFDEQAEEFVERDWVEAGGGLVED